MKFFIVLALFSVAIATTIAAFQAPVLAKANVKEAPVLFKAGDSSPPIEAKQKQSVQFGKVEENEGKARVYDPCNYNPYDHAGCTSACFSVGYYYGGFCSGYDCYCYI